MLGTNMRKEQLGSVAGQLLPELRVNVRSDQDFQYLFERKRIRAPEQRHQMASGLRPFDGVHPLPQQPVEHVLGHADDYRVGINQRAHQTVPCSPPG